MLEFDDAFGLSTYEYNAVDSYSNIETKEAMGIPGSDVSTNSNPKTNTLHVVKTEWLAP